MMTIWVTDEYTYQKFFFPMGKEEKIEKYLKEQGWEIMEGIGVTNKPNLLYFTIRRRNRNE